MIYIRHHLCACVCVYIYIDIYIYFNIQSRKGIPYYLLGLATRKPMTRGLKKNVQKKKEEEKGYWYCKSAN
jgi:hypothetical protein